MKKYCVKPFNTIRLVNDSNGVYQYQPCCHYRHAGIFSTPQEYLESDGLKQLQEHFLTEDYLPSGCEHCRNYEAAGHESTRQLANRLHSAIAETNICDIEIFPSNACNLNCVMCQPRYSTGVALEYKQIGWLDKVIAVDNRDSVLTDLKQLSRLERLTVIGGEFFLAKSCIDIMDFAIEKNLYFNVITNATVLRSQHLERLKQIKHLDITISIDAVEEEYEFIRYPASWSTVSENVKILKQELPQAKIHVNAVVQVLNIQVLENLILWCNRNVLPLTLSPVAGANWLSWQVLDFDKKTQLVKKLNELATHKFITTAQNRDIKQFILNIEQSEFDAVLLDECRLKLSTLVAHRQCQLPQTVKELITL